VSNVRKAIATTLAPIPRVIKQSSCNSCLSPTLKARMQSVQSTTLSLLPFLLLHPQFTSFLYASTLLFFFCSTFSNSARLMWGRTPPNAIVARIRVSSSSSPRMASCKCRGVIRLTFRSLAALPASSRTSAVRYSRTAVT
jgi:hypothetical protein